MRWIVALMVLGGAAVALALVQPDAQPPKREDPVLVCLREWQCVGPLQVRVAADGAEYGMYSCEYGIIFLRKPDLQS